MEQPFGAVVAAVVVGHASGMEAEAGELGGYHSGCAQPLAAGPCGGRELVVVDDRLQVREDRIGTGQPGPYGVEAAGIQK